MQLIAHYLAMDDQNARKKKLQIRALKHLTPPIMEHKYIQSTHTWKMGDPLPFLIPHQKPIKGGHLHHSEVCNFKENCAQQSHLITVSPLLTKSGNKHHYKMIEDPSGPTSPKAISFSLHGLDATL